MKDVSTPRRSFYFPRATIQMIADLINFFLHFEIQIPNLDFKPSNKTFT